MTFGSLFSGVGGFDLGLENVGMSCYWQVEKDKQCQKLLAKHWPDVVKFEDVRETKNNYAAVDIICGGDPCPCRSKARYVHNSHKSPDLSGYFLAVVERMRPRWVLRENVPASDDKHFSTCLELLGYRTIIISTNSAKITAQNRERDFIVGCPPKKFSRFINSLPVESGNQRYFETKYQAVQAYPLLTTKLCRWDARDGYIWDGQGIRVADCGERCRLAGFPFGWFSGFSRSCVARMIGNSVVPQLVEMLGRCILQAEI